LGQIVALGAGFLPKTPEFTVPSFLELYWIDSIRPVTIRPKTLLFLEESAYTGIAGRAAKEAVMSVVPKVLIVDDDQDFRASVRALLESHGYRVLEAESGHEGLRKVADDTPDVILLDIMMESSVEGYGITHSLRYRDEFAAYRGIPIIMVSSIEKSPDDSYAMSPEVEMIRPDAYLTKPLDIDKFLKLLREVTSSAHV